MRRVQRLRSDALAGPEEVAEVILFLASDKISFVNGVDPTREAAVAEKRAARFAAGGWAFDVTDETGVVEAFARFDAGTEIEILINNAGIQVRRPPTS
jgi:NAD(P)-dependent dehydrogenase (short-subunit alcohol dehydrogenase family)